MIELSYEKFLWHSNSRSFTIEASDIERQRWSPGLPIKVKGKQHTVLYVQQRVDRDREGDIQVWEYAPHPDYWLTVPECRGTKVVVFND